MSFLLDTDICSAYLKGNQAVFNRVIQYGGQLSVSAITVSELLAWTYRSNAPAARRVALDGLLAAMTVHEVNQTVAEVFGRLRAQQLDQGTLTPSVDLFIASTAIAHGLTLVTHNQADFASIPGLMIADWITP